MDVAASFDLSKFHNVRPDVLERMAEAARPMGVLKPKADVVPLVEVLEITNELLGGTAPEELVRLAAEVEETLSRTLL